MECKKVVSNIAFVLVIIVLFSGCHELSETESLPNQREYTFGLCLYKFDDTYVSSLRAAIEKAAKDMEALTGDTINIHAEDGQAQQFAQNDQVDTFIAQGYDGIIVNMVDRTAAAVIIDKAKSANIPITFFNREPVREDLQKWDKVYYVGSKAEESGKIQGDIAIDLFKAGKVDKDGDGKIQYVLLEGEPGHQDALLRTEWAIKQIEASSIELEKLSNDTAMWQRNMGQERMGAWISAYGDKIELVLANNDDMALGAIEALKNAGYFGSDGKYMPVIGVDAVADALDSIEAGLMAGTVLQNASAQGEYILKIAYAMASGKDVNQIVRGRLVDGKYVWVPYQKVVMNNIAQFK